MRRYLFLPILLIFISCTTVNASKIVSRTEIEKASTEVTNNIEQYDLSRLTFMFSDVKVITKNRASGTMIINYGNQSNYYIVTWKKTEENGKWKISNVAEKK